MGNMFKLCFLLTLKIFWLRLWSEWASNGKLTSKMENGPFSRSTNCRYGNRWDNVFFTNLVFGCWFPLVLLKKQHFTPCGKYFFSPVGKNRQFWCQNWRKLAISKLWYFSQKVGFFHESNINCYDFTFNKWRIDRAIVLWMSFRNIIKIFSYSSS